MDPFRLRTRVRAFARFVQSTALISMAMASGAMAATSNYIFTTNTAEALTDMSSGTTPLLAGNADDMASTVRDIGFDFYFQGTRYTQFSVNDNGLLRLGNLRVQAGAPYLPLGQGGIALLAPFASNQRVHESGRVHYRVVGAAPDRVLVVEWSNMQSRPAAGSTADMTYQARLHETTGVVEYVYGGMTTSPGTDVAAHIGVSSGNTATNVGGIRADQSGDSAPSYDGTSATAFQNVYAAGPIAVLSSAADGARRSFSISPPAVSGEPINFAPQQPGATQVQLNWNPSAVLNAQGFVLDQSSDNGATFSFVVQLSANATGYNAVGLTPGTVYQFRLRTLSEGRLGPPISVELTTFSTGTVTSTAAGGPWNQASTWLQNRVPTATDDVVIGDGSNVVIDAAATALSLQVGTGTGASAVLAFETTTGRALSVGKSVRIAANGVFRLSPGGTTTAHNVVVGTDLVNDGVLDFFDSPTSAATITFSARNNGRFYGTGTNDLYSLVVSKSTAANMLEFSPDRFVSRGGASTGFLSLNSGTFKFSVGFTGANAVWAAPNYTVVSTAAFWMDSPNYRVTGQSGVAVVVGEFRLSRGTYEVGTLANFHTLTLNQDSKVLIEGGALTVASRFGVQASTTPIRYTQTAGTVTVSHLGNNSSNLASFDMGTAAASLVDIRGGNIVVEVPSTAVQPLDYRHQAGTAGMATVTGGTLALSRPSASGTQTYRLAGVMPNVSMPAANHRALLLTPAPGLIANQSRDLGLAAGTTFDIGNAPFLFKGATFINEGTLTAGGAASDFIWANVSAPVVYAGAGFVTAPVTRMTFQAEQDVAFDPAVNDVVANTVVLLRGDVHNSGRLVVGSGGSSTATVQIGDTAATPAGVFDEQLRFNPGTGGTVIRYLRTPSSRPTGFEIPPTRTVSALTYDAADPSHTLTLSGGNLTVGASLLLNNGRVVTGGNVLDAAASAVTRVNGYVDGNLRRTVAGPGQLRLDVGTANGYSPVTIDVTGATAFPAVVSARADEGVLAAMPVASAALARHWTLASTGVSGNLVFNYLDPDLPSQASPESELRLYRAAAQVLTDEGSVNALANTAAAAGAIASDWTLGFPVAPDLEVAPNSVVFEDTLAGAISPPHSVQLRNTGTVAMQVTALEATEAAFARTAGGDCGDPPFELKGGANCSLEYVFQPAARGDFNQTLGIVTDPPEAAASFDLVGEGLLGQLDIGNATIDFGQIEVGTSSPTQAVALSNIGTASLQVAALDAPNAPFVRSGGTCAEPIVLGPGDSCTLVYGFNPTVAATANQTLAVDAGTAGNGSIRVGGTGVQGVLSIADGTFDFGPVVVGETSAVHTVTLSNTGTSNLQVGMLEAASGAFALSGGTCAAIPFTLAPGANCELAYRFAPSAMGPANQVLDVDAGTAGAGSIALSGTGLRGVLSIIGGSIDFGEVAVGQSSIPQTVKLANAGTADLRVDTVQPPSGAFAPAGAATCGTPPFTLAPNASCTLSYGFTPTVAGPAAQSLALDAGTAGNGTIDLSGTGVQGVLTIANGSIDFGAVVLGESSNPHVVRLSNTGTDTLEIGTLETPSGVFALTGASTCPALAPFTLARGANCTLVYVFTPDTATASNQTLAVDAGGAGAGSIALSGRGVQGLLAIADGSIDFGPILVGQTSAPRVVTLSNVGSADLRVDSLEAPSGAFALAPATSCAAVPFTLAPNAECQLVYTFAPTATGAAAASLELDAGTAGNGIIVLSGTGVRGTLTIVNGTIDFGEIVLGQSSAPRTVTLSNSGTADIEIASVEAASGAFLVDRATTCAAAPFTLAPDASCDLVYVFAPTVTGLVNQSLAIDAGAAGAGSIELRGTGLGGTLSIADGTFDFGAVIAGHPSAVHTVTLSNSGTADLQVDTLDTPSGPFSLDGRETCRGAPFTLAPNASCTLGYFFTPRAAGPANQTLAVDAGSAGSGAIVLSGTGEQGLLTIANGTFDFGDVAVGEPSAAHAVTLSNTGEGRLRVETVVDASGDFALDRASTCASAPFELAPNEACDLVYVFTPTREGVANLELAVDAGGAGNGPILLSGAGVPAAQGHLTITPQEHDFGSVRVGQTGAIGAITLGNDGEADVQVIMLSVATPPFVRTADGSCGNSLPIRIEPGRSCTITYGFQPSAARAAEQVFQLDSVEPGDRTFRLLGQGTPAADPIFRNGFEN
jgi:hypothetical protein